MLDGMTQAGTDWFLGKVREAAIDLAEVPPYAEYEIRYASKPPESSEEVQVLDKCIRGKGAVLIAALTD
jgi:hypothetical protein